VSTRITVHYRDETVPPGVFNGALDDRNTSALIITESITSYGERKVTRIPWDLIKSVETGPR
jgi:hypothetical protein